MPEPRTFTIALPPGTRVLSANNRLHKYALAAEVKRLRNIAITLAKQQHIPPLGKVTILLEYQLPSARHPMASQFIRDHDNLYPTLKALTDGIRRAGVIFEDSRQFVLDSRPKISDERYPLGRLLLHIAEVVPESLEGIVTTHVVVTWGSEIPAAVIIGGVLAFIGIPLAMATRYPLAAYTGVAMTFAGWTLMLAWSISYGAVALMALAAVMAAFWGLRLWSQRATVRAPGEPR